MSHKNAKHKRQLKQTPEVRRSGSLEGLENQDCEQNEPPYKPWLKCLPSKILSSLPEGTYQVKSHEDHNTPRSGLLSYVAEDLFINKNKAGR